MFQSTDNTYRYILKSRQKPSRRPDPHPPLTEHCVLCGRGSPGVWTCANPDCLEPSFEIRYVEAPMQSNRPDTAAIDLTTCVYLDLETTGREAAAEVVAIALRDAQVPQPGPRPRASTASLPPRWPPAPSCKAWALSLRSHSGAHAGGRTLPSSRQQPTSHDYEPDTYRPLGVESELPTQESPIFVASRDFRPGRDIYRAELARCVYELNHVLTARPAELGCGVCSSERVWYEPDESVTSQFIAFPGI